MNFKVKIYENLTAQLDQMMSALRLVYYPYSIPAQILLLTDSTEILSSSNQIHSQKAQILTGLALLLQADIIKEAQSQPSESNASDECILDSLADQSHFYACNYKAFAILSAWIGKTQSNKLDSTDILDLLTQANDFLISQNRGEDYFCLLCKELIKNTINQTPRPVLLNLSVFNAPDQPTKEDPTQIEIPVAPYSLSE